MVQDYKTLFINMGSLGISSNRYRHNTKNSTFSLLQLDIHFAEMVFNE